MGDVLIQAKDSDVSAAAVLSEEAGGPCLFDCAKSGLRLRPIMFFSSRWQFATLDYHSYMGESATGLWAIDKLRHSIRGNPFT
jgi:hypothetical protein